MKRIVIIILLIFMLVGCNNSDTIKDELIDNTPTVSVPTEVDPTKSSIEDTDLKKAIYKANGTYFSITLKEFKEKFNNISDAKIGKMTNYGVEEHGSMDSKGNNFPYFSIMEEFDYDNYGEIDDILGEYMVEFLATVADVGDNAKMVFTAPYDENAPNIIDDISLYFQKEDLDKSKEIILDMIKTVKGINSKENEKTLNEIYKIKDVKSKKYLMGVKDATPHGLEKNVDLSVVEYKDNDGIDYEIKIVDNEVMFVISASTANAIYPLFYELFYDIPEVNGRSYYVN